MGECLGWGFGFGVLCLGFWGFGAWKKNYEGKRLNKPMNLFLSKQIFKKHYDG